MLDAVRLAGFLARFHAADVSYAAQERLTEAVARFGLAACDHADQVRLSSKVAELSCASLWRRWVQCAVPVPIVRVHVDRAPAGPQMAVTLAVWFVVVQRFGALVRMACWPTVWSALRAASPTVRPCAGASLSCGVPVVGTR